MKITISCRPKYRPFSYFRMKWGLFSPGQTERTPNLLLVNVQPWESTCWLIDITWTKYWFDITNIMSISHINYMGMTGHSLLCFSVFNPRELEILSKHVVQRRFTFQGISKAFYTHFSRIPFVQNTQKKDLKKSLKWETISILYGWVCDVP